MSPRLDNGIPDSADALARQAPAVPEQHRPDRLPDRPATHDSLAQSAAQDSLSTQDAGDAENAENAESMVAEEAEAALIDQLQLPEIPPYDEVGPLDARALSKTLFARLETLEEGTHEFAYVRNTLVELNLALVKFAASRFRSRSEPMEDIVQVGTIGLIKAIDRFELSRGVEFPTFAMPTIVGEIKRFFRDTSWSVRVPRRLQELRLDLAKAGDELAQRLDRAPTVEELAKRLNLSTEEVVEGMAASNAYTASSLDAQPEEDDTEGALADRIGYEDHGLEGIEYVESLKPLIAELPARDRRILSLRFVANMTQSEIGEELGISQMHVSRLLSRTLSKLRKGLMVEE
ncbi:RNA polymerase sigma factor SigF [Streptomyces axinellae]|uniref:RNA polymerase sigma factor SigF n=1 Tax=Streptomyces axinellae TaxID=552788 RepID=A0ABP6CFV1_9ACTN